MKNLIESHYSLFTNKQNNERITNAQGIPILQEIIKIPNKYTQINIYIHTFIFIINMNTLHIFDTSLQNRTRTRTNTYKYYVKSPPSVIQI